MPEKVRVSPTTASQLSTGGDQAALLPEEVDDEPLDDELLDDEDEEVEDEESDDLEVEEEDDEESEDVAGTDPLPEERLSVR